MLANKYRIKEIIFADGHKRYIAQDAVRFFGVTLWWKDHINRVINYYGCDVSFICYGNTYEECKDSLMKNIKEKEDKKLQSSVVKTNYYYKD